jgi:hypothetical protein
MKSGKTIMITLVIASLTMMLSASQAQQLPFFDNFNSGNINNWQNLWTNYGPNPNPNVAFNNQTMNITTHDATTILVYNGSTTWSNYSIDVDATVTQLLEDAAGYIRVEACVTNPQVVNPLVCRNSYEFWISTRDDNWGVYKHFSNSPNPQMLIPDSSHTWSANTPYHFTVEIHANGLLKFYVNGELLGQVTDSSPFAGGMVALWGQDDVVAFDNLLVRNIPQLDITMSILNPPIIVPAQGGNFNFNVAIVNHGPNQSSFYVWARMKDPNGTYTQNPTLGPVPINIPLNFTVSRLRTQTIQNTWPGGISTYLGYANWTYSYPAMDSSWFTFTKSTTADGGPTVWEAICSGEPFPGEIVAAKSANQPASFMMCEASPNPFNPTTTLGYELPAASLVKLNVYDTSGRLVTKLADGFRLAGMHEVTFDGSGLASGVYLYTLTAGQLNASGKMVLLK